MNISVVSENMLLKKTRKRKTNGSRRERKSGSESNSAQDRLQFMSEINRKKEGRRREGQIDNNQLAEYTYL